MIIILTTLQLTRYQVAGKPHNWLHFFISHNMEELGLDIIVLGLWCRQKRGVSPSCVLLCPH